MSELVTRDDFDLPEPEYPKPDWGYFRHREWVDYRMGDGTIESNEPLNDKPYKEIGCEPECKVCPHGKLRYFTHQYGGQYQSILCIAGRYPVCVGGFLKQIDVYI